MSTSCSRLAITWRIPDIEEERWEFFLHPAKQGWYQATGATWEKITTAASSGILVPYPRAATLGEVTVALSYHRYEDYRHYLAKAKRGYRKSYTAMEDDLQSTGELTLKAPIVLCNGSDGLLFSGYRRLCLAWNYGMVPYVWLVKLG
jgi:hypothetical protein